MPRIGPGGAGGPAPSTVFVPCNPYALYLAISHAHYGETPHLAPGCTYHLPDALPRITTKLTIMGYHSTRTRDAGSFSLLTVGGGCTVDLALSNVHTNRGTLHVTGGTFSDNKTGEDGGAIYTEDDLHAGHITVTANAAGFDGGGIYNDDETVTLSGSTVFGNQPDNCHDVPGC